MFKYLTTIAAALVAMTVLAAAPASALPLSFFNLAGTTPFEDDDGEVVVRPVTGANGVVIGFAPVVDDPNTAPDEGVLQVGDIFLGVVDVDTVNGNDLDVHNTEITGLFVTELTNISGTGGMSEDNVTETMFADADLDFGALSASDFNMVVNAVLGVNVTPSQDGTIAMLFEDPANDLDLSAGIAAASANAVDGALFLEAGFNGTAGERFRSINVPLSTTTFSDPNLVPGDSQLGTFGFTLTIFSYFGPGLLASDVLTGNGSLQVPNPSTNSFPVATDTDFSISVIPEPTTVGLLGLGLLGLGAMSARRRRKAA